MQLGGTVPYGEDLSCLFIETGYQCCVRVTINCSGSTLPDKERTAVISDATKTGMFTMVAMILCR